VIASEIYLKDVGGRIAQECILFIIEEIRYKCMFSDF
jgi:hypothetical protein